MTDISQKQGGWTPGLSGAPIDGTLFLAWAVTPTYDQDERRTVMAEEPVIAQVVFGEAISVPFHSMPQGRRLTHWQPIQRPARANPSTIKSLIASAREAAAWRPMESAPTDGTVIIAMARFRDATAGAPAFVSYLDGAFRELGRTRMEPMVCWAWKPREVLGAWPNEANPPQPHKEEGG